MKIWVVDDDPNNRDLLFKVFDETGHLVVIFGDVMPTLAPLRQGALPEVIISDMQMPGMSGLELLEYVRQNKPTKATPFVLMSGVTWEDAQEYREECQRQKAIFLSKPFSLGELGRAIREAIALVATGGA